MQTFTPADKMPALTKLADACFTGACNPAGIALSLGESITEVPATERRTHPALKIVVGQLSWLLGESLGPTTEAIAAYHRWQRGEA